MSSERVRRMDHGMDSPSVTATRDVALGQVVRSHALLGLVVLSLVVILICVRLF